MVDLFDSSTSHDFIIKVEEAGTVNGNPKNAVTKKTVGKPEWTIVIDDEYARNATQLSIARTIIHESVHAFIGKVLETNRSANMTQALQKLYTHYKENNPDKIAQNLTQHEFMSQYVDAISQSLSIWDNNKQAMSYYKKLSWAGLESSTAYQAQPNKNDIQSAILSEKYGYSNSAKGTRCPR